MSFASEMQINSILLKIKESIEGNGKFTMLKRDKNEETLAKLGLLTSHIKQEILSLTYMDYCGGPEQNKSNSGNQKGSVWKFGKMINGYEIYIKLHIVPIKDVQCICISFHEAEEKLKYPYKKVA